MADDLVQIEPSEHVKNPGRVAWGKKLARMSKELKEKKKAQHGPSRTEPRPSKGQIEELIQKDIKIDTETKSELDLHRVEVGIAFAGLVIAGAALYFTWQSRTAESKLEPGRLEQSKIVDQPKLEPSRSEQYDPRNF